MSFVPVPLFKQLLNPIFLVAGAPESPFPTFLSPLEYLPTPSSVTNPGLKSVKSDTPFLAPD